MKSAKPPRPAPKLSTAPDNASATGTSSTIRQLECTGMSRIFDALRGSAAEHSAIKALGLPPISAEPQENSETDHRSEPRPRTTSSCFSCESPILENSLFCPKCEAFLGSVVTERQCNDDCEQQEGLPSPERPSGWTCAFWLRIRRLIALGSALVLVLIHPLLAY